MWRRRRTIHALLILHASIEYEKRREHDQKDFA